MNEKMKTSYILSMVLILTLAGGTFGVNSYASSDSEWQDTFNTENCDFSSIGANDYFILIPGHQLILQ